MKKWGIFLFATVAAIAAALLLFRYVSQQQKIARISSFEECAEAGFPILESYPPQCHTSDGKRFTQYIGNELEFHDEILISSPRPNQSITSPLKVSGQARGSWYFEGSFSGELFDSKKNLLGTVILQAQGEWMTEEFVPFEGVLEFSNPSTEKGELVIKNANPSGLPENEKTLIIPVSF